VQGKEDHGTRNTMLLLAGITAGIMLNPLTGPPTRKWVMEKITGESSDDFTYAPSPAGTSATTTGTTGTTEPEPVKSPSTTSS
jgi:hypothetical protein